MNLANLENAREQLKLADNGVSVHIQDAIDSVDSAIRELEALPVVPTIKVGQVWRHKKCPTKWTMEILCVGNDRVFVRNENGYECSWEISMLTANYTLQTPAPEVVEVDGIKVGSQWVSKKYNYKYIVESVDASNNRVNWKSGGFDHLDTLRDCYKEEVALTADDVSDGVLDAYENRWRHTTYRDAIAAAITAYLAEKEKESGNG